jgi:hypothetical protein
MSGQQTAAHCYDAPTAPCLLTLNFWVTTPTIRGHRGGGNGAPCSGARMTLRIHPLALSHAARASPIPNPRAARPRRLPARVARRIARDSCVRSAPAYKAHITPSICGILRIR